MANKLIVGEAVAEIEIKKSKFICYLKAVTTKDEAEDFIKEIKKLNYKATHNVFCYLLNEDQSVQKYSDDGEPQGTAGLPMLSFFKKEGLYNIAAVVTRYFGGIKLGASGLLRAYTAACKAGLEAAKVAEIRDFSLLEFELDFTYQASFEHRLRDYEYYEKEKLYTQSVGYKLYVELEKTDELCAYLLELTRGRDIGLKRTDLEVYILDSELTEIAQKQ